MKSKCKVVVIGSLNRDYTIETTVRPKVGETVLANQLNKVFGGKGANQAVAAARAGAEVAMIGAVGTDEDGKEFIAMLENEGIETKGITEVEGEKTGMALITVCDGDNSILVVQGANQSCTVNHVSQNLDLIDKADVVLLQLEIPIETIEYTIQYAYEKNKKIILNPAPMTKIPAEVLSKVTVLTPNEIELEMILNNQGFTDQAQLLDLGIKSLVVTQGEIGCIYQDEHRKLYVQTEAKKAVDTTGAGDCFNGYLAANLTEKSDIKEALDISNKAATISVMKKGAIESIPTIQFIGGI